MSSPGIILVIRVTRAILHILVLLSSWMSWPGFAPCFAAEERQLLSDYSLHNWQTENGLPQNSVSAILQTRDGYLWLGTYNGLVRFDGIRFTIFNIANTPELGSDSINCLFEDHKGQLWIGTDRGGLTRYVQGRFTNYRLADRPRASVVTSLAEDDAGVLWLGTDGGLYRLVDGRMEFYESASAPEPFGGISSLCWDRNGQLWIASERGFYAKKDGHLQRIPEYNGVKRVTACADGGAWLISEGTTLVRLPQGHQQAVSAERIGEPPWSIANTSKGGLWLWGTKPLVRVRGSQVIKYVLPEQYGTHTITTVYEDREENLWVGLNGAGLMCLREKVVDTISTRQGLADDDVAVLMEESPGRVWIGGFSGGIGVWESNRFNRLPALPLAPQTVYALSRSPNGAIWIGVRDGRLLGWKNGKVFHDEKLSWESARIVFADREGDLWVGSRTGGVERRFNEGKQKSRYTRETGLSDDGITAITQDREGAIWVGTRHGLNRIHKDRITHFYRSDGLGSDCIHALFVDQEGVLWAGTVGGGLAVAQGGRFVSITAKQGLANEVIGQILDDGRGFLWLGSNGGILRVKREDVLACARGERTSIQCRSFGRHEGMINPECAGGFQPACLKAQDGRLWFATVGGVVIVDPVRLKTNSQPPSVRIESVLADGIRCPISNPGERTAQARIPAGTIRIEIAFTGLSFVEPESVRFQFQLEGLHVQWVDVGFRRNAYFNRLGPGEYSFRVRACNSDGLWNQEGSRIHLIVEPFWWQTAGFRWLAGIGMLGIATAGVWRAHVRQLHRALEEQERRNAEIRARELGAANQALQTRTIELECALAKVKTLNGLIPICADCKKIRDDKGYWEQVESYVTKHSDATFTHGLCPTCVKKYFHNLSDSDLPPEGSHRS